MASLLWVGLFALGFSVAFVGMMLVGVVAVIAHHYNLSLLDVLRKANGWDLEVTAIQRKDPRAPRG